MLCTPMTLFLVHCLDVRRYLWDNAGIHVPLLSHQRTQLNLEKNHLEL